mgnify:CR=1 FL=1
MRSKEKDDSNVLTLLEHISEDENARGLNKHQIEVGLKAEHPTPHRAVRETIQRLEDEGAIAAVRTERGRAPNTKSKFYTLTELGAKKLAALKGGSAFHSYINVDRARQIVEEEEAKLKLTPEQDRACLEMGIAHDWFTRRLRDLVEKALAQTKKSRDVERVARTVSHILLPDLATFIKVCYRHRNAPPLQGPLQGLPISYLAFGRGDEYQEALLEWFEKWFEKFAPSRLADLHVHLPEEDIAETCILSRTEAQARRELVRADREIWGRRRSR